MNLRLALAAVVVLASPLALRSEDQPADDKMTPLARYAGEWEIYANG